MPAYRRVTAYNKTQAGWLAIGLGPRSAQEPYGRIEYADVTTFT